MQINFDIFQRLITEGFVIQDDKILFDPTSTEFIKTSFGKGKKMSPYRGKLPFGEYYAAYSSNKESDKDDYKEVLKAIKGKSDKYKIDPQTYERFLERTAIYLSKFILENKIDTILVLESSSPLLYDVVNKIQKRLPKYFEIQTYNKAIFKNPDMSEITIDAEKYGIDKSTERNLNKTLDKMKGEEYFSISGFPTKFRGVFRDWLKVNDLILSKIVDKNVCLVDDFVTTGSTMKEASKLLEDAGAKSVLGLCVLKGGH